MFLLTLYFSGTIHNHIPMVSTDILWPRGKTSGWSKASLKMYDFPFLYGPAIDTTHTGPTKEWEAFQQATWSPFDFLRKLPHHAMTSLSVNKWYIRTQSMVKSTRSRTFNFPELLNCFLNHIQRRALISCFRVLTGLWIPLAVVWETKRNCFPLIASACTRSPCFC